MIIFLKIFPRKSLDNDYSIRRAAIDFNVPLITNARLGAAFIYAFLRKELDDLGIRRGEFTIRIVEIIEVCSIIMIFTLQKNVLMNRINVFSTLTD